MRSLAILLLVLCCNIQLSAQVADISMEAFVKTKLIVLDSVAKKKKLLSQLSTSDNAMLYLSSSWIGPFSFDDFKGFEITRKQVRLWRKWFQSHMVQIDSSEFWKAIDLYQEFLIGKQLSDSDFDFLSRLESKYHSLH